MNRPDPSPFIAEYRRELANQQPDRAPWRTELRLLTVAAVLVVLLIVAAIVGAR